MRLWHYCVLVVVVVDCDVRFFKIEEGHIREFLEMILEMEVCLGLG